MNHRRQFGPLLTLRQLHFLLKANASVQRFLGVPAPTNAFYGGLKRQCNFRLLSLQNKVRKATLNNPDCLSRRATPLERCSPLLPCFSAESSRSSKKAFTSKQQPWISVRDDNPDIVSNVDTIQMRSELAMSVDVNHPLAVNRHSESHVISFTGDSVHPLIVP